MGARPATLFLGKNILRNGALGGDWHEKPETFWPVRGLYVRTVMSELQSIRQVMEQTTRRRRLAHALGGLWKGLFAGAALLFLALAIFKMAPIPPETLYWAAGL